MKLFKGIKYKGIGFVEALIALTVSGIVGIVLMSISAQAIYELRKLDIQDSIAQHAVSTGVILQNIAIEENLDSEDDDILHSTHASDKCFGFKIDNNGEVIIDKVNFGQYQGGANAREDFKDDSLIPGSEEYFRYFCLPNGNDANNRKLLVKIVTGSNKVEGKVTSDRDVKDYEYFAIIIL